MNTLLVVLAFVLVGLLVYRFWKPMIQPPKRDVKPDEANLYFFYTNWCGFSQKAMPEWTKIEQSLSKTRVHAISVDCETDRAKCALYDIQGYPTVLLETKAGIHEYTKRVTHSGVMSFLRETLGEKFENL